MPRCYLLGGEALIDSGVIAAVLKSPCGKRDRLWDWPLLYRRHHDPSLSDQASQKTPSKQSKLLPLIAPQYERRARYYGVTLQWEF